VSTRLSLPFADWPVVDRVAWQVATEAGDLFDGSGPAAGWAPSTRASVCYDYGRWLMFLARHEPVALDQPLALRPTPERIAAYLDHLATTVGSVGRHGYIRHLADALRVMAPGQDWAWLRRVVARLEAQRRPRSKPPRLVEASRLLALGYALMQSADRRLDQAEDDRAALLDYRDGLMIALLAARPLRRRNLAMITIGRHLICVGDAWHLVFAAKETKTGQPIEAILPDRLVPYLEHYLRAIRPRFPGADRHAGLWAGLKGRAITGQAIYDAIIQRTRVAFGHGINPHLFRDCAATTIAITAPDQIGVARDLLGHASLVTTEQYYNQARAIDASRLLARELEQRRTLAPRKGIVSCAR
jgi:integrase